MKKSSTARGSRRAPALTSPHVVPASAGSQKSAVELNFPTLFANDVHFRHQVAEELKRARAKHVAVPSYHHFYGVLVEEVAEFFDLVRQRSPDPKKMEAELIQIAAVAQRCATELLMPQYLASIEEVPHVVPASAGSQKSAIGNPRSEIPAL